MKFQRDWFFDDQEIGIFQVREEKDVRFNDLGECLIFFVIWDEVFYLVVLYRKIDFFIIDWLGKDDFYGVVVVSVGKCFFIEYEFFF